MERVDRNLSHINSQLLFINRQLDIMIEQQKLSNMLLNNIVEILRVPDSEKERQHSIELGIKFFVNASKDSDLYDDALEELLKAESLMRQDYFVLHRIGSIYLHVQKHLNPSKALDYFLRAAKYASVESDSNAIRLVNFLTEDLNNDSTKIDKAEQSIGLLASESYEKAAFSAYVLGQFNDAVTYQSKALYLNKTPQNHFLLAKYQARIGEINNASANLNECIDQEPILAIACFKELDLINEPEILKLISNKNNDIDNRIKTLAEKWSHIKSEESENIIHDLNDLLRKSYEIKKTEYENFSAKYKNATSELSLLKSKIETLIESVPNIIFPSFTSSKIDKIIFDLHQAKMLPYEKMQIVFNRLLSEIEQDKIKIGSKYAGGFVFYLDESEKHGLVIAEDDFGYAIWGGECETGASAYGIADGSGEKNTKIIDSIASWQFKKTWFGKIKEPTTTAAKLCLESNHNGFNDWYLPTIEELKLLHRNLASNPTSGNWSNGDKVVVHPSGLFFRYGFYWSSTEFWGNSENRKAECAFGYLFGHKGDPKYGQKNVRILGKNQKLQVRGVRVF
jgi:tetratricopeptide (TPR) repeat protein